MVEQYTSTNCTCNLCLKRKVIFQSVSNQEKLYKASPDTTQYTHVHVHVAVAWLYLIFVLLIILYHTG